MVIIGYSWHVLGDIRQVLGDHDHIQLRAIRSQRGISFIPDRLHVTSQLLVCEGGLLHACWGTTFG